MRGSLVGTGTADAEKEVRACNKLVQIAIIGIACIAIAACNQSPTSTPEKTLSSFLNASLHGKYQEAYSYVSSEDKSIKDLQSFLKEKEPKDDALAQAIAKKTSYKILRIEESGNTAKADVELTMPDIQSMFTEILGSAFKAALIGGGKEATLNALTKKVENGEVPQATKKETFKLVKEKDGWKVHMGWKAKKLLAEAEELKKSKKLYGAAKKYEQVLELDSEMVEAKTGLEETKNEIKEFEEKQAYIKNVALYDLKAKYYSTYSEDKMPGVEFKIKNNGDRSLKKVEVTVYFKDANGTIIAEEQYNPVWVTKYSFGRDNKPLKPGYVWQLERGKFYKAASVPSEWKEGAVAAKITDIEFGQ